MAQSGTVRKSKALAADKPKRESLRACDRCRARKLRCDGPEKRLHNTPCTHCKNVSAECTFDSNERRFVQSNSYAERLEKRLSKVEQLLHQHCPEVNLMQELGAITVGPLLQTDTSMSGPEDGFSSDEDEDEDWLTAQFDRRGNGSVSVKDAVIQDPTAYGLLRAATLSSGRDIRSPNTRHRLIKRPEYWEVPQYELQNQSDYLLAFRPRLPPPDELSHLVDIYYRHINAFCPVLHRPLFEQQLRSSECMQDSRFVAIVLLVCAMGERFVETEMRDQARPPGSRFFEQIEPFLRIPTAASADLLDVQIYLMSTMYLAGTPSSTSTTFMLLGVAIRLALQAGSHRAKFYLNEPNLLDEQWKRAFWVILVIDRYFCSSVMTRPTALPDESFDLSLPLAVGDDDWDLSDPSSRYPLKNHHHPGPVELAFFNAQIQLSLIIGTALRTLYSINRSRLLMGFVGAEWERRIVLKLEESLSNWLKALPEHLRWNPHRDHPLWFSQSALLHTAYCGAQMIVHNPLMSNRYRLSRETPLSNSSDPEATPDVVQALAICISAAHFCVQILRVQIQRGARVMVVATMQPAFMSGLVLMVNFFGSKAQLSPEDAQRVLGEVRTCMDAITLVARVIKGARAPLLILYELTSGLDYPLPPSSLPADIAAILTPPAAPPSWNYSGLAFTHHRLPRTRLLTFIRNTRTTRPLPQVDQVKKNPTKGTGEGLALNQSHQASRCCYQAMPTWGQ
ncbi:fungal-specific transcription factor domain-containing protein [Auriculariales sp. MPI-PUGE-AT-0066]|nr:fungal-specific transcription factor domain-containing protein [Auriculariales sp. MPI-PUGE-AT-0066]